MRRGLMRLLGALVLLLPSARVFAQQVAVFGTLVACTDCNAPQGADPLTGSTSSVTETGFDIAGTCNPQGQNSNAYFQIASDPVFTSPTNTTPIAVGSGGAPVTITGGSFSGLTCATTYYVRAVCQWTVTGAVFVGATVSQATSACTPPPQTAPVAVTSAATQTTHQSFLMNGTCDPEGTIAVSRFRCGTSTGTYNGCGATSSPTGDVSVGAGSSAVAASAGVTGATASTQYFFKHECENAGGIHQGAEQTVTTSAAPGGDPAQLTSSHLTYLGMKNLVTTTAHKHLGLTIRYIAGVRHLITGTDGSMSVRQFNETGIAYGGTIGNAQVTNTWSVQGAPQGGGGSGIWGGVHWDETNDELITTNSNVYTQPNTTNIFRRTLVNDNTISGLQGPYLLTGVGRYQIFGGCIDTPSAIQTAWSVGRLACGWGGGMSTVGNGACLGLCVFFLPDLSTLTPSVSSTNFQVGSRKPFSASDSCNLTTCKRGIRLTSVTNYSDANNDSRNNTQSLVLVTVNIAADGVTVTCTSSTCAGPSGANYLGRNGGNTNSASNATLQTGGGWWVTQSTGGALVTILGATYAVKSVDSFTQLTLSSAVPGSPHTGVQLRGPDARPAGWNPWALSWATEDGNVTWTQGDSHLGTCVWPYSSTRTALVCFPNLVEGKYWYASSDVHWEGKHSEAHFYNVNHLKEVIDGTRQQSHVQPIEMNTSLVSLINAEFGTARSQGAYPRIGATAAVMDYGEEPAVIDGDEMIILMACRPNTSPTDICKLYYYAVDLD